MRLIRGRASTVFVKVFSAKRERSAAAPLLGAACASGLGPSASGPPSPPLPSRSAPTELAQSLRSSSEIRPTLQFPAKTAILATSPSPRFLHQKVANVATLEFQVEHYRAVHWAAYLRELAL